MQYFHNICKNLAKSDPIHSCKSLVLLHLPHLGAFIPSIKPESPPNFQTPKIWGLKMRTQTFKVQLQMILILRLTNRGQGEISHPSSLFQLSQATYVYMEMLGRCGGKVSNNGFSFSLWG